MKACIDHPNRVSMQGAMSNSLLAVTDLACMRGGRVIFSGVSFTVAAGDALLVTGANGSGKTSLLRLLAGLGDEAVGTIHRGGLASYLGHANALKPALSVAANLAHWAGLTGEADPAAISALGLAPLLGLPVRVLSQGQQRRVALARTLVAVRPIWLMDEPTVGLDAATVDVLSGLMAAHRARGGAIVAATHMPLGLVGAASLELAA